MTELLNFLVYKRLAVPAMLESDFRYQFLERNYPKTRLMEPVDSSTVLIVRHYGKQRSADTKNRKLLASQNVSSAFPPKYWLRNACVFIHIVKSWSQCKRNEKVWYSLLPELPPENL